MNRNTPASTWRAITLAMAALAACSATGIAQAGGVSVGVNIGVPVLGGAVGYGYGGPVGAITVGGGYGHRRGHYRGWSGGWGLVLAAPWVYTGLVLAQPQTVVIEQPVAPAAPAAQAAPPSRPDPVIYPRNGQTPQQLEADRQECNRWATTQPAALADSSVFMRAVDACMDGRGYTTK